MHHVGVLPKDLGIQNLYEYITPHEGTQHGQLMIPIFGPDMWILLNVVFARHAWHATDIDNQKQNNQTTNL